MAVLVTGATGSLGRCLIKKLAEGREQVKALVRPTTDAGWLQALGIDIVRGDIGEARAVEQAAQQCRIIFHLAAKTDAAFEGLPQELNRVNVQGTEHVARAALLAGVERVVFCSSVAVYGRLTRNRLINEQTALNPDTRYGESKVRGEHHVLSAWKRDGLPVTIARIATVLGPEMTNWLGLFQRIASGKFRLIGTGQNSYHFVDVADAVEGLLLCGARKGIEGQTFILAGREPVQLRTLVQLIGQEVGVTEFPPPLPGLPLHAYSVLNRMALACLGRPLPRADRLALFLGDRIFDTSRAGKELDFSPRISVKQSIHAMVEWFRAQGHLPGPG